MNLSDEPVSARPEEIETLLERVRCNQLGEQDLRLWERLLRLLLSVVRFLEQKNTSLARLKRLLFGSPSDPPSSPPPASPGSAELSEAAPVPAPEPPPKRPGHGRLPGSAYTGATPVRCLHPQLHPGACCPDPGCGGRLFDTAAPAMFIRLTGQPLVGATRYEQQVLRCSTCQQRYTAPLPEGVPAEKYDVTADVAIVMAQYAAGLPFHRLARMQQTMGVPLSESVQWERCEAVADALLPIYLHLRALAAQADVFISDDTRVQILSCQPENQQRAAVGERHGLHTTGLVAQSPESIRHEVVLYTSGRKHAGENVGDLLRSRPVDLAPPLQVGDALAANWSHGFPVIAVKCLAHARQQFVDIEELFPTECRHVREALATVYRYDAETQAMTPEQRLAYHQRHSAPVMEQLQRWMEEQFQERRVEPNSVLGKALAYLQRHWKGLTQFLFQRHAPLDSNAAERALKRVVLHRKNALFFRTEHGAAVGDILMSVIETCRVNGIRAWEYLLQVMRNRRAVREDPARWLPWTYAPAGQ
jgi:transposase